MESPGAPGLQMIPSKQNMQPSSNLQMQKSVIQMTNTDVQHQKESIHTHNQSLQIPNPDMQLHKHNVQIHKEHDLQMQKHNMHLQLQKQHDLQLQKEHELQAQLLKQQEFTLAKQDGQLLKEQSIPIDKNEANSQTNLINKNHLEKHDSSTASPGVEEAKKLNIMPNNEITNVQKQDQQILPDPVKSIPGSDVEILRSNIHSNKKSPKQKRGKVIILHF